MPDTSLVLAVAGVAGCVGQGLREVSSMPLLVRLHDDQVTITITLPAEQVV
ncbi:hypothetical protein ACWDSJ_33115 [Nocardia sp. NPDC003482]